MMPIVLGQLSGLSASLVDSVGTRGWCRAVGLNSPGNKVWVTMNSEINNSLVKNRMFKFFVSGLGGPG